MDTGIMFYLVIGLACPLCMGAMMWLMNKHMSQPPQNSSSVNQPKYVSAATRLAELREQRERIDAEIAELNQLVELEAQHAMHLISRSPVQKTTTTPAAGLWQP